MNIIIIGAGPIGSFLGYLASKEGYSVDIYEEHKEIGLPIQCTGIVTSDIYEIKEITEEIEKAVINKIEEAIIISRNEDKIFFRLKKKNLILDRYLFDNLIVDKAKKAGARIHLNSKCSNVRRDQSVISAVINGKSVKADIIIGADGPNSIVRKSISSKKIKYWSGVQVTAKYKNDNYVEFYPFKKGFSWVVPENKDTARIGLLARTECSQKIKAFLMKKQITERNILNWQGGIVPYYDPYLKTKYKNIMIVGDAATQVKATTGGGLVPGLLAAKACIDSIVDKKSYNRRWKRKIGTNLLAHLMIRKTLDTFSDNDYNKLFKLCSQEKIVEIIEKNDRENAILLITKILYKEPRLLRFALNLIKSLPS